MERGAEKELILVYAAGPSPRLDYVLGFLSEYLGAQFRAEYSGDAYAQFEGAKINYRGAEKVSKALYISPHGLLNETDIKPQSPQVSAHSVWQSIFFESDSELGFDLFGAIFYLISRYEEYLPYTPDTFGRYPHTESLAHRTGFLHLPLINLWLQRFAQLLNEQFQISVVLPRYTFIPTYDIDIAWSFLHKGLWRNAGGMLKDAAAANGTRLIERLQVLRGHHPDPYDVYDWLETLHAERSTKAQYFFHTGLQRNRYDKNISPHHPAMQGLVKRTANRSAVGLHPSWATRDNRSTLWLEKKTLEAALGKRITASRQHYIRFRLPQGYRVLLSAGIEEDWSMGYGSINGFRASVAAPFWWYDLEQEEETRLRVYPFSFMDANAFWQRKQSPEEALKDWIAQKLILQTTGGTHISVWHNNVLGREPQFAGWRDTYEAFFLP